MATGGIDDTLLECGSDAVGGKIGSKCGPCRRRDRSEVASMFCNTCKVFLCDDCCEVHRIHMTIVYEHNIVAANEAFFKAKVDMKGLDQCLEHTRVFMFYCDGHNDLCCEICAIAHHRKCDDIHAIEKVAKNVIDDVSDNIRASIATATKVIMKCKEDQLNNVSRVEEIVKEIDFYKEYLLTKIEEAKARIVSEMANHYTQEDERLNTRRYAAENLKRELDTHLALLDSVRENGTETEMFILSHILKRTQDKASQTLNALLKNDDTVKVGLKINEHILKIKTTDVALFSLNKTLESKTQEPTTQKPKTQSAVRLELFKTKGLVKTGDDKEQPFATGLDFLPDGRIVAVDVFNCKCFILSDTLKRFDKFYKFPTYPRDVTFYSDNNIAVTVSEGDIRTICLLTVGSDNTITLMKTLTMSTYCCSICPLNDRTFVVSTYDAPRPARMIGVDGKESDFDNMKFPGKTYKLGASNCTYIQSRDSIVLTDRFAHAVYMYNTVSDKNSEVKGGQIREPKGACVGPDDSVFVCSKNTNSVIQISPDGDILASCDVDMKHPYAVAVSRDGSRMVVTNGAKGVKTLKLFKIIQ